MPLNLIDFPKKERDMCLLELIKEKGKRMNLRAAQKCLVALILCAGFSASISSFAQAPLWLGDWYPSLELNAMYDSNINRSFDGDGEKSDFVIMPRLRMERQDPLGDTMFTYYAGTLSGEIHGQYNKLNYIAPGVDGGVRIPLGDHDRAPVLLAGLALKYEFHDQDMRFGAEANPRLEARIPFADQASVSFFYEYDNRFASENSIYDRDGHTLGFYIEADVNEQIAVTAGYAYRKGDVLVHQPREDLGEEIRGRRLPLDTFKNRYDAVKFDDEDTHYAHIGLRYALDLYTSLHLGFAYEQIKAEGDTYPSTQLLLGLKYLL